mmetsp:Transcript_1909/g.5203  ORF Transcript_1909/g.5203 Transcript_1909/m.5203 type:complete len:225 (-) Transcript_1909:465-1139(-)
MSSRWTVAFLDVARVVVLQLNQEIVILWILPPSPLGLGLCAAIRLLGGDDCDHPHQDENGPHEVVPREQLPEDEVRRDPDEQGKQGVGQTHQKRGHVRERGEGEVVVQARADSHKGGSDDRGRRQHHSGQRLEQRREDHEEREGVDREGELQSCGGHVEDQVLLHGHDDGVRQRRADAKQVAQSRSHVVRLEVRGVDDHDGSRDRHEHTDKLDPAGPLRLQDES